MQAIKQHTFFLDRGDIFISCNGCQIFRLKALYPYSMTCCHCCTQCCPLRHRLHYNSIKQQTFFFDRGDIFISCNSCEIFRLEAPYPYSMTCRHGCTQCCPLRHRLHYNSIKQQTFFFDRGDIFISCNSCQIFRLLKGSIPLQHDLPPLLHPMLSSQA